MRRYETIVIVDPDLAEPERKQRFDKVIDLISQMKGVLIESEDWGAKRLAYEIKKKTRGHYLRFDFCGSGELVSELERNCRIDDKFLKYMTIILQDNADPEKIKSDLEESRAKKAAEEATRAAQAELAETARSNGNDDDNDDDDDDNDTDDASNEEDD